MVAWLKIYGRWVSSHYTTCPLHHQTDGSFAGTAVFSGQALWRLPRTAPPPLLLGSVHLSFQPPNSAEACRVLSIRKSGRLPRLVKSLITSSGPPWLWDGLWPMSCQWEHLWLISSLKIFLGRQGRALVHIGSGSYQNVNLNLAIPRALWGQLARKTKAGIWKEAEKGLEKTHRDCFVQLLSPISNHPWDQIPAFPCCVFPWCVIHFFFK